MKRMKRHGTLIRGFESNPKSPQFEGVFGRLFRTLPAAKHSDEMLKKLAEKMVAEEEGAPTPETEIDNEENQGIDAGYTYFGQFIDHDLTFDPASSLQKQNDPDGLIDYRTPRFDLDNLYGRGPDDQPYLYADNGLHFLLGRPLTGSASDANTKDVPRNTPNPGDPARALLGDPRNDENVIVSQLQGIMLRFHNSVANFITAKTGKEPAFTDVQQLVRWHYQWVVLHDFLPAIVGKEAVNRVLPHLLSGKSIYDDKPRFKIYKYKKDPFIPIEFAAAVYRFGHSMVRPIYRLNTTLPGRQTIFSADENASLNGFRAFPDNWAIDWNLFFGPGNGITTGPNRVQKSYKIDTSLVNPLGSLPPSIAKFIPSLAERNLLRGAKFGLPSGQSVAHYLQVPVVPDEKLRVGKATEEDTGTNIKLVDIDSGFKHNAPLWYYILAEAQQAFVKDDTPIHLGPVGGSIVAEVFIGLLLADSHSFLSQNPNWKPLPEFEKNGAFTIKDLITQAQTA